MVKRVPILFRRSYPDSRPLAETDRTGSGDAAGPLMATRRGSAIPVGAAGSGSGRVHEEYFNKGNFFKKFDLTLNGLLTAHNLYKYTATSFGKILLSSRGSRFLDFIDFQFLITEIELAKEF
jgi:hypothetical protein